ncbi:hypothetical protein F2Q69_00035345 [Brassica cretica]|uniref:Uncharacterized protein n=1 Tax=Brassica cretica TaxID=69181 RepID=A0A8S9SIZ2_BRACR|nr:hypothetical protein F2Q69_00035345 [Brassica cretica]
MVAVGVENGCDEANVQIPAKYKSSINHQKHAHTGYGYDEVNDQNVRRRKRKTLFDKYFFEIDSSLRKALRRKHETSDKSSKRVATQRPNACSARSQCSNRALLKRRYDISPCILVYPSMLSPEDHSEPISCFPPF